MFHIPIGTTPQDLAALNAAQAEVIDSAAEMATTAPPEARPTLVDLDGDGVPDPMAAAPLEILREVSVPSVGRHVAYWEGTEDGACIRRPAIITAVDYPQPGPTASPRELLTYATSPVSLHVFRPKGWGEGDEIPYTPNPAGEPGCWSWQPYTPPVYVPQEDYDAFMSSIWNAEPNEVPAASAESAPDSPPVAPSAPEDPEAAE